MNDVQRLAIEAKIFRLVTGTPRASLWLFYKNSISILKVATSLRSSDHPVVENQLFYEP